MARAFWLALAVALTTTWLAVIASQWSLLTSVCHQASSCQNFQLNASSARLLAAHDISPVAYAIYTLVVVALVWSAWCGVGAVLIKKRPDDPGAVTCAFFLILFPLFEMSFWLPASPVANAVANVMSAITFIALIVFCLVFPTGRFVPRWTGWVLPFGLIAVLALRGGPAPALILVVLLLALIAQAYRFRFVSNWSERQQAKWAFAGLMLTVIAVVGVGIVPFAVRPQLGEPGTPYEVWTITGVPLVTAVMPLSIGIAMLRSRLYDIDRIISRALLYTTLTVALVAIYIGGVIGLQALIGLVTANSSGAAIVISTLVVAALFGPLRKRMQSVIDQRFYRSRYDANQTLSLFGERLRDEVDLASLCGELTTVVHETLRPEHVSLWLNRTEVP